MRKIINALLVTLIGWLLPSCKTTKAVKPASQEPAVMEQETAAEAADPNTPEAETPQVLEPDTVMPSPDHRMRVLYGPPSSFRR